MLDLWDNLFFLINRYLHIVCTTLLVGGTLFYEMVVPVAIGELKSEQQLLVFGRARWMFRSIVWTSGVVLILTGIASTVDHWGSYRASGTTLPTAVQMAEASTRPVVDNGSAAMRADWWWVAHASTGTLAVLIAFSLTTGATPPARPVQWMRVNLMILLIVIFLATVTRHVRQFREDRKAADLNIARFNAVTAAANAVAAAALAEAHEDDAADVDEGPGADDAAGIGATGPALLPGTMPTTHP
ncbi:MAG TPA: hypothetical protein VGN72_08795 [Tepidisphaeraceae bacterium]|jgi:uncharacterized membrane protein YhaH (DUF805 family)|nr:hypothetical protein [Tepidisphaeraceae bacterium]